MDMVRGARKAFGYRSNLLRDAAHLSAKGVLDQFGAYICQNHTGTLREALFWVALSQALRARLRSHRLSGTFRNKL
jgi:hypothetical protein